jgi:glycosyltransferase involved in cell wall biosynthesis
VHWEAFRRYRNRISRDFEVVLDEVNTVPFFTPLWASIPRVMFIHQLAREVWWYESRFPTNLVGFLAEPIYLRCYRNTTVITVSESTRCDLRRLGFRGAVRIIPEGIDHIHISDRRSQTHQGTQVFLYVGRLSPSKRIEHIIRAFSIFRTSGLYAQLRLAGDGPAAYVKKLHRLVTSLNLVDDVKFLGRIAESQKHGEMASAEALLLSSAREGWGLVVTEANAVGTPAIAYDVPGLRDSVRHDETGILVRPSSESLAAAMHRLSVDGELRGRLSNGARDWARTFSFQKSFVAFRAVLASVAHGELLETDDGCF